MRSDGPYKIEALDYDTVVVAFPNGRKVGRIGGFSLRDALNDAHSAGIKAERERCLSIIERWRPMTKQSWVTVSDEIEENVSEAKGERIHLYTCRKTEEDKLSCPLCSYALAVRPATG